MKTCNSADFFIVSTAMKAIVAKSVILASTISEMPTNSTLVRATDPGSVNRATARTIARNPIPLAQVMSSPLPQ